MFLKSVNLFGEFGNSTPSSIVSPRLQPTRVRLVQLDGHLVMRRPKRVGLPAQEKKGPWFTCSCSWTVGVKVQSETPVIDAGTLSVPRSSSCPDLLRKILFSIFPRFPHARHLLGSGLARSWPPPLTPSVRSIGGAVSVFRSLPSRQKWKGGTVLVGSPHSHRPNSRRGNHSCHRSTHPFI